MTVLKFKKMTTFSFLFLQTSCSLVDQFKERFDESKEEEKVQKVMENSKQGLDKAKEGIESAKEVRENVEQSVESLKVWNQRRLERKEKRKAQIAKLSSEHQKLIEQKEIQFETDIGNARVVVIDHGHYLTCELQPIEGTFARLPLGQVGRPVWLFNGTRQVTLIRECGSSQASHGVGLGGGGVSCDGFGPKQDWEGFYPYMAPSVRSDTDIFQCRMGFSLDFGSQLLGLLSESLPAEDTVVTITSDETKWNNWSILKNLKHPNQTMEFMEKIQ